ncbi:MAG: elongation factor 4 [Candidatus Wildermuthbacteria bacterium]|nr:elongation factor 4 [Candidatus Wildermuthbacteria bacterium]MBI2647872.1 elongation factor 4 [Candidatus Wildermuthbacteria bacterium]
MEPIRNFCIIAHIDHGKSTLADRFLELTRTVEHRKMREQYLDQMDLEREKGITIKMQPVRMRYKGFVLNLIDTPGHADFSYEVSRSLAAVEGAILLVDATKGVQAQTLAHLNHAQEQGLVIIPAVNKIDSPLARTKEVSKEVADLLSISQEEVFHVSAREGTYVEELLDEVTKRVPPPRGSVDAPPRALIFDSRFDTFKGIVAYVRVVDGTMRTDEKIRLLATGVEGVAKETGYFLPQDVPVEALFAGEIGYVATGIKDPGSVRIGDTISSSRSLAKPLAGYQLPKPMVFVSFYPQDQNQFDALKDALAKLRLSDPSFTCDAEAKEALGRGFRCGFLGVLHSEIIAERIQREFKVELVISRPSVEYEILTVKGKSMSIKTPSDWPQPHEIAEIREPIAALEVIAPISFFAPVVKLLHEARGVQQSLKYLGENSVLLMYDIPLREIIGGLHDRLKSVSQGFSSMDYAVKEWRKADLVKLDMWVAGEPHEALSTVVAREDAHAEGKAMAEKLKELLPAQQYDVALQAVIGGKVVARETIRARRKDVTAPLYGGDVTRKNKLLQKQKKGKKELRQRAAIQIPSKVFLEVFRSS